MMAGLAEKFLQTFFQQIPNGVCLIFAIGSLVATVFILSKRRHHGRFYAFLWCAFFFMGLWRCFKGIIAVRYAAILIYPMVAATAFAAFRGEAWWRLLCRRFPRLPGGFGRVISLACLFGCAGGALLISHYKLSAQPRSYTTICRTIAEYRKQYPDIRILVRSNDADRLTYHTKVPSISVAENKKELFLHALNCVIEPDKHFLVVAMDRQLGVFEPRKEELRPDAEFFRIRAKRFRKSKRKDLDIYFYRNPLTFSRIPGPLPAPSSSQGGLLGPGAFGPRRFDRVFSSPSVRGTGGFRFTFVLSADQLSGKSPMVEIRTAWREGNGEVRPVQVRCPLSGKGVYRGVLTFRVPFSPFELWIYGHGAAIRLEQFQLTRRE